MLPEPLANLADKRFLGYSLGAHGGFRAPARRLLLGGRLARGNRRWGDSPARIVVHGHRAARYILAEFEYPLGSSQSRKHDRSISVDENQITPSQLKSRRSWDGERHVTHRSAEHANLWRRFGQFALDDLDIDKREIRDDLAAGEARAGRCGGAPEDLLRPERQSVQVHSLESGRNRKIREKKGRGDGEAGNAS